MKQFFFSRNIQNGWKDYQGVIHTTYHVGFIETDHRIIFSIPKDAANKFVLPKFTARVSNTLKEFHENDTTTRDKTSLK